MTGRFDEDPESRAESEGFVCRPFIRRIENGQLEVLRRIVDCSVIG